jgi:branched-chain amino acid transport system substrate-binding protein
MKFIRLRAAACGGLLLLGVLPAAGGAAPDPYEINAIVSLTGQGAFLGTAEAATLGALQDRVNRTGGIGGRPIHFAIQDDQSSPQIAVQLTNAILAKNVPIVMGSSLVAACNAMAALMKNGPVQFCFSSGFHPAAGNYGFAYGVSTDELIAVTVRYFHDRGWKKVAIITSIDASGQDGERGFDVALGAPENKDMTVVAREHFSNSDVSVAAQMSAIKAAAPDALITWTSGTPFATLLRGAQDVGLTIPMTASAANLSYEQFKQLAPLLPKTLDIAAMPSVALDSLPPGRVKNAVRDYVQTIGALGLHADNNHGIVWDPASIVIAALKRYGTGATAAQLHDYIAALHDWAGIIGEYDFRDGSQRGVGRKNGIVVRWDPAKQTWSAVSKFGGAPL